MCGLLTIIPFNSNSEAYAGIKHSGKGASKTQKMHFFNKKQSIAWLFKKLLNINNLSIYLPDLARIFYFLTQL